jgi:hypothetical protein
MGFTVIYIAISVSFILWVLLLLLIISKLGSLNNRVARLIAVLGEFEKMDKESGPGEGKSEAKQEKPK